jgi:hypothetical protein
LIEGAAAKNDLRNYFEISVHRIWYQGEVCGGLIGSGDSITATSNFFRPLTRSAPDVEARGKQGEKGGKCLNFGMLHPEVSVYQMEG